MKDKLIYDMLLSYSVPSPEKKAELLSRYVDELILFNPTLKLVGSEKREDIVLRHILDCLAAYPIFNEKTKSGMKIADLGSGAGLPGIVLAIVFEDRYFYLIERMKRRVGFLRSLCALLGLKNVEVLDCDLRNVTEHFDYLTSRAFHPLKDICKDATKLSDKALFYKGQESNIKDEIEALRKEGYSFVFEVVPITISGLSEERNIVFLNNWEKK